MRIPTNPTNPSARREITEPNESAPAPDQAPEAPPTSTSPAGHPAPGPQPSLPSTGSRRNSAVSAAVPRMPEQVTAELTSDSLTAWAKVAGLSPAESADRESVQRKIMAAATADPQTGVLTQGERI
jgi:hypothetical protein